MPSLQPLKRKRPVIDPGENVSFDKNATAHLHIRFLYQTTDIDATSQKQKFLSDDPPKTPEILKNGRKQVEAVGEMLKKMRHKDLGKVIASNPRLLDAAISSIGDDEDAWTILMAKHDGVRNFFRNWHQRKLDERDGKVPRKKRPRQKLRTQIKKDRVKKQRMATRDTVNIQQSQDECSGEEDLTDMGARMETEGTNEAFVDNLQSAIEEDDEVQKASTKLKTDPTQASQDAEKSSTLTAWEEAQKAVRQEFLEHLQTESLFEGCYYQDCSDVFDVKEEKVINWITKVCLAGSSYCEFTLQVL